MQVTVEYTAQVKRAAGVAVESVTLAEPCTVQELVANVAKMHGEGLARLLFASDGVLHPSILLFVGDRQVRWDMAVELQEGDVVTILSPISGG